MTETQPRAGRPADPATLPDFAALPSAVQAGRISAVAGRSQRDLQDCASAYGELFPRNPFDPALFSTVALANAFCAPWLDARQLQIANRSSLWAFALDWQIDYLAGSREEVAEIVRRCLAVADGAPPAVDDALGRFLADIRAELAAAPAFGALYRIWREEFELMVDAMAREWDWQAARQAGDTGALPSFAAYLDNADNICFSFVFTSHWISASAPPPIEYADEVRAAGRVVQGVIRLLNDLGTYHRDVGWGDLNPLMLGVSRAEVEQRIAQLVAEGRRLLRPLSTPHPLLAAFLERYIGFNTGFYAGTDYWGSL